MVCTRQGSAAARAGCVVTPGWHRAAPLRVPGARALRLLSGDPESGDAGYSGLRVGSCDGQMPWFNIQSLLPSHQRTPYTSYSSTGAYGTDKFIAQPGTFYTDF